MSIVVARYDVYRGEFKYKLFDYASRDDILAGFRKVCPNIIIDSYSGASVYIGTLSGFKSYLLNYNSVVRAVNRQVTGVFVVMDEQVWWVPNMKTTKFKLIEEYRGKVFPWRKK